MIERLHDGDDIYVSEGMYFHLLCSKNLAGNYDVILLEQGIQWDPQDVKGMCIREGLTKKELDDLLTDESVEEIFDGAEKILTEAESEKYDMC